MVTVAGDVAGDGQGDIVVDSLGGPEPNVSAYNRSGEALYRTRLVDVAAVASVGDVDGDGVAHFAGGSSGGGYVYSGRTGATLYHQSVVFSGYTPAVGFAGDLNDDGRADFFVSALGATGTSASVFVYQSRSPPPALPRPVGLTAVVRSRSQVDLTW